MTAPNPIRLAAAALWLGGALLAAGGAVQGLSRLVKHDVPVPPARLTAGLELTRSCAARLPDDDDLLLWSTAGPAEPEAFGFLWMLASYRETPRAVAPLFPVEAIDRLERERLLDRDLATLLRERVAALPGRPLPSGFVVWSDRPDDPPRCETFPGAADAAIDVAQSNVFGLCCLVREGGR